MTELDDKLVPKVFDLIARLGKEYDFTVETIGDYNEATGEAPETGSTVYAKVKASPPFPFERRYINGDTIRENDVHLWLPAKDLQFDPAADQQNVLVKIDGAEFKIIGANPMYSGELIAVYDLHARKL